MKKLFLIASVLLATKFALAGSGSTVFLDPVSYDTDTSGLCIQPGSNKVVSLYDVGPGIQFLNMVYLPSNNTSFTGDSFDSSSPYACTFTSSGKLITVGGHYPGEVIAHVLVRTSSDLIQWNTALDYAYPDSNYDVFSVGVSSLGQSAFTSYWINSKTDSQQHCGVMGSFDEGETWKSVDEFYGPNHSDVTCWGVQFMSNGQILVNAAYKTAAGNHIPMLRVSTDNGATWSSRSMGIEGTALAGQDAIPRDITQDNRGNLYAKFAFSQNGIAQSTLLVSTDNGISWIVRPIGGSNPLVNTSCSNAAFDSLGILYLTCDPVVPNTTQHEAVLLQSADQGVTWSNLDTLTPSENQTLQGGSVSVDGNGTVYYNYTLKDTSSLAYQVGLRSISGPISQQH